MLDIPGLFAEKNISMGDAYTLLVEIEYAAGQFFRVARIEKDSISFEGFTWGAFGIGNPTRSQSPSGQMQTFDLPLTNVGRVVQSLLEQNIIEGQPGRLLTVDRNNLGDPTAKMEEAFTVVSAACRVDMAVITCAGVRFNWLTAQIPAKVVTRTEFPGVLGSRSRFF